MLIYVDGVKVEEYDKFINISKPLPEKIIDLTGITDEMLENEGVSEEEVAYDLKNAIEEDSFMVAHNAQFDLSFIYFLLKRHFEDAYNIVSRANYIDTLTVLKDRKDYPHKLIDAVNYYDVDKVNFHRAIDDTKALYFVTQEMKNRRDDLMEYKNIFGYNPKWGISDPKFDFIDYRSQPYHNSGLLPQNKILPRR